MLHLITLFGAIICYLYNNITWCDGSKLSNRKHKIMSIQSRFLPISITQKERHGMTCTNKKIQPFTPCFINK